jgi:hypothetical protein
MMIMRCGSSIPWGIVAGALELCETFNYRFCLLNHRSIQLGS